MTKIVEYNGVEIVVSESGEIVVNGKTRIPYRNKDGYPVISVKTNKGWRSVAVHRLIALAFVPNPDNLPEVNHKDCNRENFAIENLEWTTHADNVKYSADKGHYVHCGEDNPNYGNHALHERYKADPALAKEKQSRPGEQNGRYKTGKYAKKCND